MPAPRARAADGVLRRHALVVGVGDHPEPRLRLPFAVDDARRVASVLRARGFRVTALHDEAGPAARPTRARVAAAIARLARAADADDLVVAYFCCHGLRVDDRPYLYLRDTPGDVAQLAARGLPLATLLAGLRGGPRWTGIFLDVCQMGLGLDPDTASSVDDAATRAGGFALLAASTSTSISQDTADGGVFTRALVGGLAGAAADADGGIRFSALARHIQAGVARWREGPEGKLKLSQQRPVLRLEAADLHLVPPTVGRELTPAPSSACTCAACSPDGRVLATGHEDRALRLWDARRGTALGAAMMHEAALAGCAFVDGGRTLESVSTDGVVRRWRMPDGAPRTPAPAPLGDDVAAVAWSPGGGRLLAALMHTDIPGITDVAPTRRVSKLRAERLLEHARFTYRLVIRDRRGTRALGEVDSPPLALACAGAAGGHLLGTSSGELRWWDPRTAKAQPFAGSPGPVSALALSPDGRRVAAGGLDAAGSGAARGQAAVWELAGSQPVVLAGHPARVQAIAWRPDGAVVATACADGVTRLWEPVHGQLLRELVPAAGAHAQHAPARALVFTPDGRRLLVGHADGRGVIFELEARR